MKVKFTIPTYVQKVARILSKEGYDVYLVGGAIRDIVMGKTPHDFDLATNALPDEMLELFPKAVSTGAKFGTVIALVADVEGENKEVEVTTFRSEAEYIDGRWPSKVEFVNDLDKDL
ncbi:MAG: PolyA polymerase protein, partial [candidate division WS6 bacterium GW2011_GWE1_34_7]